MRERYGIVYDHWANHGLAHECATWTVRELGAYRTRLEDAIRAVRWAGDGV